MEIISFVLGMLAVIGVATVTLVVVGMVKMHNLKKEQESIQQVIQQNNSNIYNTISDEVRYLNSRIESLEQRYLLLMEDQKRDIISYIDSRIDKLSSKKEVLKG